MSYAFPPDIDAMVQRQLATGQFESPDDVLRTALGHLEAEEGVEVDEEDVRAIQEALDLLAEGDEGVPVDEAFDLIRKKYNISADT